MSGRADLPDLNVWLALATADHKHHDHAVDYWESEAARQVLFCTVTALGLVRLVSQAKVMGAAVKSARDASELLQAFCQLEGVGMATPTSDGWDVFHQLVAEGNHPARLCTDTYLAALAISNGWRLVSFDRDFERFAGLERLLLA